ncbi:coiled-coil domain-containing protein [Metamycoplasma canadense]|uniref:Lipoprotein n=1 Tax=Metamycoplasma canadense TaxID=29554 RepID=A0A077LB28_9BACT|nr:variable surface lipoprotein [Metamycoplasma canadense]BAP39394.1 hypothetical protein MCAN360_0128 [Metamycoplasma canadense]
MKKLKKFLLTFGFLAPLATLPILSAACDNKKEEAPKEIEELNKIKSEHATLKNKIDTLISSISEKEKNKKDLQKLLDDTSKKVKDLEKQINKLEQKSQGHNERPLGDEHANPSTSKEEAKEAKKEFDKSLASVEEYLKTLNDEKYQEIKKTLNDAVENAKKELTDELNKKQIEDIKNKIEEALEVAKDKKIEIEIPEKVNNFSIQEFKIHIVNVPGHGNHKQLYLKIAGNTEVHKFFEKKKNNAGVILTDSKKQEVYIRANFNNPKFHFDLEYLGAKNQLELFTYLPNENENKDYEIDTIELFNGDKKYKIDLGGKKLIFNPSKISGNIHFQ